MKDKCEKILADPGAYRQEQITRKLLEDFGNGPEEEREEIVAQLEDVVASFDPVPIREEILQLGKLIRQACVREERGVSENWLC